MSRVVSRILLLFPLLTFLLKAQTSSDLTGLAFIIDPGHSQNENVGMYGYSEAYKVLDVAFNLREFLQQSKADTVALTRTNRITIVSISQRYTFANNFPHPNKWFHSIHSDAANLGSSANSILVLISDVCASSTPGVKICSSRWGATTISMGNWMSDLMSRAYRIPTRGVYGDKTFGLQFGTSYGSAGIGVLRETTMAATLSEGGFHTNPRQNLLNLNNESKRTEAKAIWLSILGHFGVSRPPVRTLLGIISDRETNVPLNGVIVTTGNRSYRTNTYENTFEPYCGSDMTCSNGFYYFENLPLGSQSVTFSAIGYSDTTVQVSVIDSFFTFLDVELAKKVVRDANITPSSFALSQNYPNPFNPETKIIYDVGKSGFVRLSVTDLLGRHIRTFAASDHEPGRYTVTWDGRDENGRVVASGIYLYRLQSREFTLTRKMVLLK